MIAIVIDDDAAVRDSIRELLESAGHEVFEHPSAEDFLRQPRGNADCLVVHHHLPGMTGLDLLERLQAEGDQTPGLLLAGSKDARVLKHAERIGVKVLEKPILADQLLSWLAQIRDARAQELPTGD